MIINQFFDLLQKYWWGFLLLELVSAIFIFSISKLYSVILGEVRIFWKEQCYLSNLLWTGEKKLRQWLPKTNQYIALHAIKAGTSSKDSTPLVELLETKVKSGQSVLILGEPGSGKTTSLKTVTERIALRTYLFNYAVWLGLFVSFNAYTYSKSIQLFIIGYIPSILVVSLFANLFRRSKLPFFFELRRFHHNNIDAFLNEQTQKALDLPDFTISRRCLFLLDGVNEIDTNDYQKFIDSWNSEKLILTSRKGEEPRIDVQNVLLVKELNDAGVLDFIRLYVQLRFKKWVDKSLVQLVVDKKFNFLKNKNLLLEQGIGRNPYWLKMIIGTDLDSANQGVVFYTFAKQLIDNSIRLPRRERNPLWKEIVPFEVEMEALGNLALAMSESGKVGFDGEQDWDIARSAIRNILGDRKESVDDVLFEAQAATLLRVEYKNHIEFSHQLVQEFFTAFALRHSHKWDFALTNIDNKKWWRTLSLIAGLVSAPEPKELGGSEEKLRELIRKNFDRNTPFSLIFGIAMKGSSLNKDDELCLEFANKFGLWPKREHVSAIREIATIIPESLINGMSEIAELEEGFAKRVGYLLIAIEGSPELISEIFLRVHSYYGNELITMSRMAPSLGLWGIMPTIYESLRTRSGFFALLRGKRTIKKLVEIAQSDSVDIRKQALKALSTMQGMYSAEHGMRQTKDPISREDQISGNLFQFLGVDVLEAICKLSESPDTVTKVKSLELIRWADDLLIIPYLTKAFDDPLQEVRLTAADSLWSNRTPDAVSLLINVLDKEKDALVQIEIVKSMELSSDARIIPCLLNIIGTSNNSEVRLQAIKTLSSASRFVSTANLPDLSTLIPNSSQEIDITTKGKRDTYREDEIKVLNEVLISDSPPEMRAVAIDMLWYRLENKKSLLSYIDDRDELVREEVVSWAHPWLSTPFNEINYDDIVKKGLTDKSPIVRRKAIECLSKYDDETVSYLIRNLKQVKDKDTRTEIIRKLGYSESSLAIPTLSAIVKHHTLHSLISRIPIIWPRERSHNEVEVALNSLGNIGSPDALQIIFDILKHEKAEFRKYAAKALSSVRSEFVIQELLLVSRNDPDRSVRDAASETLGIVGSDETVKELQQDADSAVGESKQSAVGILAIMERDDATEIFVNKLADQDESVRISSIEGLCRLSPENIESLRFIVPLFSDPSGKVSEIAIRSFVYLLTRQKLEHLDTGSTSEIIRRIEFSLVFSATRQIRRDPWAAFMSSMKMRGKEWETKKKNTETLLIEEGARKLLPRLHLADPTIKIIAAKALGKLGVHTDLPELEKLFLDDDLGVVLAAAQAINDINPDYLPEYADEMVRDVPVHVSHPHANEEPLPARPVKKKATTRSKKIAQKTEPTEDTSDK